MTMMIFVLIILERGQITGEEFYFRELTSCLEYSAALNSQSVADNNALLSNNNYFNLAVDFISILWDYNNITLNINN